MGGSSLAYVRGGCRTRPRCLASRDSLPVMPRIRHFRVENPHSRDGHPRSSSAMRMRWIRRARRGQVVCGHADDAPSASSNRSRRSMSSRNVRRSSLWTSPSYSIAMRCSGYARSGWPTNEPLWVTVKPMTGSGSPESQMRIRRRVSGTESVPGRMRASAARSLRAPRRPDAARTCRASSSAVVSGRRRRTSASPVSTSSRSVRYGAACSHASRPRTTGTPSRSTSGGTTWRRWPITPRTCGGNPGTATETWMRESRVTLAARGRACSSSAVVWEMNSSVPALLR